MKIIDVKQFSETEKTYTILVDPSEEIPMGKALPKDMATGSIMKVIGSDVEWTYFKEVFDMLGVEAAYEKWTSVLSPISAVLTIQTLIEVTAGQTPEEAMSYINNYFLDNEVIQNNLLFINGAGSELRGSEVPLSRWYELDNVSVNSTDYTADLVRGDICMFDMDLIVTPFRVYDDNNIAVLPAPKTVSDLYRYGAFSSISHVKDGTVVDKNCISYIPFRIFAEVVAST